jgi:hypothetical protein
MLICHGRPLSYYYLTINWFPYLLGSPGGQMLWVAWRREPIWAGCPLSHACLTLVVVRDGQLAGLGGLLIYTEAMCQYHV